MKKYLLLVVVVLAMAGFANAQCGTVGCECAINVPYPDPFSCAPGLACDVNSLCVDLSDDLANCGAVGNRCLTGQDCQDGICTGSGSGNGRRGQSPPLAAIDKRILRSKHNDVTESLVLFRKS